MRCGDTGSSVSTSCIQIPHDAKVLGYKV